MPRLSYLLGYDLGIMAATCTAKIAVVLQQVHARSDSIRPFGALNLTRAGAGPFATATIERFVEPAARLYEQDRKEPCGPSRFGYVGQTMGPMQQFVVDRLIVSMLWVGDLKVRFFARVYI